MLGHARPRHIRPVSLPEVLATLLLGGLVGSGADPVAAQVRARVLDLPLYEPAEGRTALPAYHPQKLVLELGPEAPRPGFGSSFRPEAVPQRLSASGLGALDALNAVHAVTLFTPMFPMATLPAAGSGDEDLTRWYIVEFPAGVSLVQALVEYAGVPGVVGAEPVPLHAVSYTPNDPQRFNQWHHTTSAVYDAWDLAQGDTSIVIAIVDTGVQYNHSDLGGTAAPYTAGVIWHNWAEMGGTPGFDDDSNGFVDDFRGWDFVSSAIGAVGEDLATADNDPKDFSGHGTFCSGMASGRTDNGVGIAGTAFKAKIMPLRVGWSSATGTSLVDMVFCAQAINYAVAKGAKVINCSWSNGNLPSLVSAVTAAINAGATVCVAAGNEGVQNPPQNYLSTRGDCVDVGATDINDQRAGFSNYGSWVDLSAAGSSVYSTSSSAYTPTYSTGSGTSFSSPFVAGAVALYQGWRRSEGKPFATPAEVLLRLRDTGDDIDAINGGYAGLIGSRLNVARLITDPPTSWARTGVGAFNSSPALVDLDGDGDEEIVIGGTDQKLVAVNGAAGDTLPGFPVTVIGAINSSPAVWDVDLDGEPEILFGTNQGRLYAVNGDGTIVPGYPVLLAGDLRAGPVVGDIDGTNPGFECVIGSATGQTWVVDRAGVVRPGWPQAARAGIYATPALHDFDGNGFSDIVVGSYDSTLYAWHGDGTPRTGWPIALPNRILSAAAIGDIDRDGAADVVVGCFDEKVYAFRANGTPLVGWPATVAGAVRSSPALADLAGNDGWLEVAVASDGPTLTVFNSNGTFASGWPQALTGSVVGGVVIGDVDDDGMLDIVVGALDKSISIFRASGQPKLGWPRFYEGVISGTPSLADVDDDDRLEIVFGTETKRLRAVDMGQGSWNPALMPWPTLHRDYLRRGSVSASLVDVAPGAGLVAGAARTIALRAAPNPAAGTMRLTLRRAVVSHHAGGDGVRLFDVSGRLVRELDLAAGAADAAETSVAWDGADRDGRPMPAGLYFARARWGGREASLRLVRVP